MAEPNGVMRPVSIASPFSGEKLVTRGSPEWLAQLREMSTNAAPAVDPLLDVPQPGGFVQGPAPLQPVQPGGTTRLFITCARGDRFAVAVESAPEWDSIWDGSFSGAELLALLPILQALNIKIVDRTGGELTTLRLDHEQNRTGNSKPQRPLPARRQPKRSATGTPPDLFAGDGTAIDPADWPDNESAGTAR